MARMSLFFRRRYAGMPCVVCDALWFRVNFMRAPGNACVTSSAEWARLQCGNRMHILCVSGGGAWVERHGAFGGWRAGVSAAGARECVFTSTGRIGSPRTHAITHTTLTLKVRVRMCGMRRGRMGAVCTSAIIYVYMPLARLSANNMEHKVDNGQTVCKTRSECACVFVKPQVDLCVCAAVCLHTPPRTYAECLYGSRSAKTKERAHIDVRIRLRGFRNPI